MPRLKSRFIILVIVFSFIIILMFNVWTDESMKSVTDFSIFRFNKKATRLRRVVSTGSNNNVESAYTKKPSYQINDSTPPWFLSNGWLRPELLENRHNLAVWPEEAASERDDRIINQLMYIPPNYVKDQIKNSDKKNNSGTIKNPLKQILLYFGRGSWNDLPMGQTKFFDDNCPVNSCSLTINQKDAAVADAILYKDRFAWPKVARPVNQLWILFLLECPLHTQMISKLDRELFNLTATYRHDSDIVTPYEKWITYNRKEKVETQRQYSLGKRKKVAWFVSNCGARNKRLRYALELSKYIQVDIYGNCGKKKCPRAKSKECFDMLNKNYKFYLAFENSNCRDYITEKFFVNGLGHNSMEYNIVPIVMGAHRDDYERVSPPKSFIHVDDFETPRHLAQYLHLLDRNDTLYNEYLEWKGNGEFVNTYFWCRLCAMLHTPLLSRKSDHYRSYSNAAKWWSPNGICLPGAGRWRNKKDITHLVEDSL